MAWFTRIDRFGDTHLCFSQEARCSCGLASAKMVVFKVNKLRPGHAAMTTEAMIETIYKKYDSTAVNVGEEGVYISLMHKVYNELGIGTWAHASPPNQDIPALLIDKLCPDILGLGPINTALRGMPILLRIQWGGSGSHQVVLDTITRIPFSDKYYAAICDPADGDVHIVSFKPGEQFVYNARRVRFSMNFGGKAKFKYGDQNPQGIVTDIVYCTTPP